MMLVGTQFLSACVLWIAIAIGVPFSAAAAGAQPADVYLELLHLYRNQPAKAAQTVAKLSPQVIDRGIQQCRTGRCSLQQIRAGAMMHAEAAELLIGPIGYAARDHIRSGRELLQIATNLVATNNATNSEVKALASFGGRWYALTTRLLLAHGHFEVARLLAEEGRIRYPDSPDLFVVLGLLNEWRAGLGLDAGDLRGFIVRGQLFDRGLATSGPYRGNASQEIEAAAREYRRAMAIDPAHADARLRLAWSHLLVDDRRVWEDLSPAFIKNTSHETRYLAHLLRGTAAERERNAPVALAEYNAARLLLPDSQTACVAVSSAHALNGEFNEAQRTAAECLKPGSGEPAVDAWTLFRLGLMDATTVDGLRAEARRP
jgi:hypothetical protein